MSSAGAPTKRVNVFVVVDITVAVDIATLQPNCDEVVVAVVVITNDASGYTAVSTNRAVSEFNNDSLTTPCSIVELNARSGLTILVPVDTALTREVSGAPPTIKLVLGSNARL